MPTYLFYPHLPDGSASMFVAYELPDDARALTRARTVLAEHDSAAEVAIWRDDRIVGRVERRAFQPVLLSASAGQKWPRGV